MARLLRIQESHNKTPSRIPQVSTVLASRNCYASSRRRSASMTEEWTTRRLRDVADIRVSSVDKHSRDSEMPIRLCNYLDVYMNTTITSTMDFMKVTATVDEIREYRLQEGDVLITKDSESWNDIGVPALVVSSAPDIVCGYHLALLRPRSEEILGGYLMRILQTRAIAHQLHVQARGVTRFGLTQNTIKSLSIPVPPIKQQRQFIEFIEYAASGIDREITRTNRQAYVLEEYRERLITDVVTGRYDVQGLASDVLGEGHEF